SVSLGIDRYDLAPGATVAIPLTVVRRDYNGPIEVSVIASHPGISGQTVVNPPPTSLPGQPPPPPIQPAGMLLVMARPDVPMGPHQIWIRAKAMINGHDVVEFASVRTVVSQNLANLPVPPLQLSTQVILGVTEKPVFTLVAKADQPES